MSTKHTLKLSSLSWLVLLLVPGFANADVYRCTESDNTIIITNASQPGANCTKVATEAPASATGQAKKTPTPSSFPKVDDTAQEAKDKERKRILQQELEAEQKSLEQAQKELSEQEAVRLGNERNYQKVIDRLQPYKDQVSLHEKNIEALKKELDR